MDENEISFCTDEDVAEEVCATGGSRYMIRKERLPAALYWRDTMINYDDLFGPSLDEGVTKHKVPEGHNEGESTLPSNIAKLYESLYGQIRDWSQRVTQRRDADSCEDTAEKEEIAGQEAFVTSWIESLIFRYLDVALCEDPIDCEQFVKEYPTYVTTSSYEYTDAHNQRYKKYSIRWGKVSTDEEAPWRAHGRPRFFSDPVCQYSVNVLLFKHTVNGDVNILIGKGKSLAPSAEIIEKQKLFVVHRTRENHADMLRYQEQAANSLDHTVEVLEGPGKRVFRLVQSSGGNGAESIPITSWAEPNTDEQGHQSATEAARTSDDDVSREEGVEHFVHTRQSEGNDNAREVPSHPRANDERVEPSARPLYARPRRFPGRYQGVQFPWRHRGRDVKRLAAMRDFLRHQRKRQPQSKCGQLSELPQDDSLLASLEKSLLLSLGASGVCIVAYMFGALDPQLIDASVHMYAF